MRSTLNTLFISLLLLSTIVLSCDDNDPYSTDYSLVPEPLSFSNASKVETESGLVYYNIKQGQGEYDVVFRDYVTVYYTKRTIATDEILSSSYANRNPLPVSGAVSGSNIFSEPGFREGVLGMKNGGIRVILIPPKLHGYTAFADDTIRVDVELVEIEL